MILRWIESVLGSVTHIHMQKLIFMWQPTRDWLDVVKWSVWGQVKSFAFLRQRFRFFFSRSEMLAMAADRICCARNATFRQYMRKLICFRTFGWAKHISNWCLPKSIHLYDRVNDGGTDLEKLKAHSSNSVVFFHCVFFLLGSRNPMGHVFSEKNKQKTVNWLGRSLIATKNKLFFFSQFYLL